MPPPRSLDATKIHVGDVVLVASGNPITERMQEWLGYGASSHWTHVAGCIGAYDLVEGQVPKARVAHLQNDYVAKGDAIKVLRRARESDNDRIKVALWWVTLNNLPYDFFNLIWFGLALFGRPILWLRNRFQDKHREICSELIADGFYKQGYNLFDSRPASNILPADYDRLPGFQEVTDIWLSA